MTECCDAIWGDISNPQLLGSVMIHHLSCMMLMILEIFNTNVIVV